MEKKPETPVPVQSDGAAAMPTHFAPPERKIGAELEENVKALTGNPLIDGLMFVANGLFAVLNEHRQVLAINESFLKFMGIEDTSKVIGLRPGEYIRCIHSCEMPGGCGTSPYCSTCGAAIATMAALCGEQPQENTCSITVERDNKEVELFFQVRCCPITVAANKFILFFLHDISIQQQRDMLDSAFFHDINNLLTGLLGKAELFQLKHTWDPECFGGLQRLIQRMAQELSMQQALNNSMSHVYQPLYCEVSVDSILNDLAETFEGHPLCMGITLDIETIGEPSLLVTDPNLVNRILVNMVTNALEATAPGGGGQSPHRTGRKHHHFLGLEQKTDPPGACAENFHEKFYNQGTAWPWPRHLFHEAFRRKRAWRYCQLHHVGIGRHHLQINPVAAVIFIAGTQFGN